MATTLCGSPPSTDCQISEPDTATVRRGFSVGSHLVRRCRKWCTLDILFFVSLLSRRKASPSGLPAHMQKSHGGLLPVEQSLPLSESLSDSLCRVGDPAPPLPERRRGAPVRRSTRATEVEGSLQPAEGPLRRSSRSDGRAGRRPLGPQNAPHRRVRGTDPRVRLR